MEYRVLGKTDLNVSVLGFGCGICARASSGTITVENFLEVNDYTQIDSDTIPIERCKPGVLKPIKIQ